MINQATNPTDEEADLIVEGYREGLDWLLNANNDYKVIIGARTFVQSPTYECYCTEWDPYTNEQYGPFYSGEFPTVAECENSASPYGTCWAVPAFQAIEKRSDGVVLEESAAYLPGASAIEELPSLPYTFFQVKTWA